MNKQTEHFETLGLDAEEAAPEIAPERQSSPSKFIVCCSKLWLIGEFFVVSGRNRWWSFCEICYAIAAGMLPFIFAGLVFYLMDSKPDLVGDRDGVFKYLVLLKSTFDKGELLLFAVSLMAPALWLSAHESSETLRFPHRRQIILTTVLVFGFSVFTYALVQAGVVKKPESVFSLSVWLTVFSVVNTYLTLTYHNSRAAKGEPPKINERGLVKKTNDFLAAVNGAKKS